MLTKICSKCGVEKSIQLFSMKGHEPGRKPRVESRCRKCKKKYFKTHNKRKREEKLALFPPKSQIQLAPIELSNRILRKARAPQRNPLSGSKACNTCLKTKEWTEFRVVKNNRQGVGLYYQCKGCECAYDVKRANETAEEREIRHKKRTDKKEEKTAAKLAKKRAWEEKLKSWEKIRAIKRKERSRERQRAAQAKSEKHKRKMNPLYRLACNLRTRTRHSLKRGNFTKNSNLSKYLGCTMQKFKSHLESLFQPGMNWSNYGNDRDQWNMDHTTPLSVAQTSEEMYRLSHYTNIRPMWASYNERKNGRMPEEWAAYKLQHGIDEAVPPMVASL